VSAARLQSPTVAVNGKLSSPPYSLAPACEPCLKPVRMWSSLSYQVSFGLGWFGLAAGVPVPQRRHRRTCTRAYLPVKLAFRRERPDLHRCGLHVPARPCHRRVTDRDADVSADVISGSLAPRAPGTEHRSVFPIGAAGCCVTARWVRDSVECARVVNRQVYRGAHGSFGAVCWGSCGAAGF